MRGTAHYSIRTEQAYVHWVRALVRFHRMRHPLEMEQPEDEAFLFLLAAECQVAVFTHRQALSTLLFLYQKAHAKIHHSGMGSRSELHSLPHLTQV